MTDKQFNRRLWAAIERARRRLLNLQAAERGEFEVDRIRVREHVVREHRVAPHWRLVVRKPRGA